MKLSSDAYLQRAFKDLEAFSVPGLGTFRKVYRDAHMDDGGVIVHPPTIEVTFEPAVHEMLRLNDHLVHNLGVSPAEAAAIVSDMKGVVQRALALRGYYEVPGIGRLVQDAGHRLRMIPATARAADTSDLYFGLKPVSSPATQPDVSLTTTDKITAMKLSGTSDRTVPGGNMIWRSALLASLLLTLAYVFVMFGPLRMQRSKISGGVVLRLDPPSEADDQMAIRPPRPQMQPSLTPVDAGTPEPLADAGTQTTRGLDGDAASQQTLPPGSDLRTLGAGDQGGTRGETADPQARFHLIAGSFSTLESARKFQQEMTTEGFAATIIAPETAGAPSYRVSIFNSADRKAVEAYANKLSKMGKKSGWVYEQ
ncbi:MAG: SPOR domain-containing protein [Bacteroidia bacterium]|nr:SPOR domain-containing protein [Bacteroidia bacterium]